MAVEPEQEYYDGIVSRVYGPLRSVIADPEPYAAFVAVSGEPALELGCGDGDPILDLRERGLDVEGLDSSTDMLAGCRAAATRRGLEVTLHHQSMETMATGRSYRSIYLAGATFTLLPADAAALAALRRIRVHLEPGGSALVPLFIPKPTAEQDLGHVREHHTADGVSMCSTTLSEVRDEAARTQTAVVRYEVRSTSEHQSEERSWCLHWYSQDGFRNLVAQAGLRVAAVLAPDATPARSDADTFVFWLTNDLGSADAHVP